MTNLIQSLPSPSAYSGGITHTWMGETWLVDGEALAVMAVKISSNSPSRRSARTETSGSRDGVSRCGGVLEGFWRCRLLPVRFRVETNK
jgi:hypothetical protein